LEVSKPVKDCFYWCGAWR